MLDLIDYLVQRYVGKPFVSLVRCLAEGQKTLNELIESEIAPYDVLSDSLKYLIRQDIVAINKNGDRLTYCVVPEAVLYYQRPTRYDSYITHHFSKEEALIVQHLLKNRPCLIEQTIRAVATRKTGTNHASIEEERFKKVFGELVKCNVVYEDERAADLHVQYKFETEDSLKKPPPQLKATRKSSSQLEHQSSSKEQEAHFFTVSYRRLLEGIREELTVARLSRRHPNRSSKELAAMLSDRTSNKYPPPLEAYCRSTCTAYSAIMQLMRQEVAEDYLLSRFGEEGLLVLKTLINRPYIDEKELIKATLFEKKKLGQALNPLLQLGLVMFYEVRISGANILMYFAEEDKLRKWCTEQLCRIIVNLHRRSAAIQQRPNQQGKLEHLLKLQASIIEFDELLILITG